MADVRTTRRVAASIPPPESATIVLRLVRHQLQARNEGERRLIRRSRVLSASSVAGQGTLLIGTVIAARAIPPEAFGVLGVFATLATIFGVVASGRLEAAVPIPRRDHRARAVVETGCLLVPLMTAVAAVAMLGVGRPILDWADATDLQSLPWAVPVAAFVIGLRALALGWATRRGLIPGLAIGRILNGVVMATLFVIAAGRPHPIDWLVAAWIAGQAAELLAVGVTVGLDPRFRETAFGANRRRRAWRRYRRFPAILVWSNLIEQAGANLPTTLVAGGFGTAVAGRFNLVHRIVARPASIIGSSTALALMTECGEALRAGRRIRPVMVSVVRRLTLLGLLAFGTAAVLGPWIVPVVLGPDWSDAGRYLLAILPGVFAEFVVLPVLPVLGLLERAWTQLACNTLRLGSIAAVVLGGGALGFGPIATLLAASAAGVLTGIAGLACCLRAAAQVDARADLASTDAEVVAA